MRSFGEPKNPGSFHRNGGCAETKPIWLSRSGLLSRLLGGSPQTVLSEAESMKWRLAPFLETKATVLISPVWRRHIGPTTFID